MDDAAQIQAEFKNEPKIQENMQRMLWDGDGDPVKLRTRKRFREIHLNGESMMSFESSWESLGAPEFHQWLS